MEELFTFFETMPQSYKAGWIIICLTFFWLLEGGIPLFILSYNKWKHAGVNFAFLGTSLIINTIFGVATVGVFRWIEASQFGITNWISMPVWLEFILCILAFDLIAQYMAHYMLHRVKWLWRLHMVHHADTHVDATTGPRLHPGDFLLRETLSLLVVVIMGAPVAYYLLYRFCTIFFTYFTHANISLPFGLDKALSYLIVTPNIHKFHHHFERPWTDTNFGNIFSFWDRIFGTFVYDDPKKIVYGLDVLEGKDDENLSYQFKLPFDKGIKTDY
jgi:sterol desaturase/sphingolipid hydroxylase (fatty acid hydroxylase superfamily)